MKLENAKRFGKIFSSLGIYLSGLKPSLKGELAQLEADVTPSQYFSIGILTFFFVSFLMLLCLGSVVWLLFENQFMDLLWIVIGSSFGMGLFIFIQFIFYPSALLLQKAKQLNKDLLFSLRHLLIQVRSGVPLYNAMVSVSEADYGIVSEEFRQTAKEISGGTSQSEALENMVIRTPSVYLRRVVWQISNALRAGSDLAGVIETLVHEFSEEERVRLQRFSKELSPWALMYLMLTVIFPTMGIAMLLVLTSLAPINVTNEMFVIFAGMFTAFQFFFIKFLKNKRPALRF